MLDIVEQNVPIRLKVDTDGVRWIVIRNDMEHPLASFIYDHDAINYAIAYGQKNGHCVVEIHF